MLFLLRYHEMFLKSEPVRRRWEGVLVSNIQKALPDAQVRVSQKRLFVESEEDVSPLLSRVFGVHSFSPVKKVVDDLDAIKEAALSLVRNGSFAVRANRGWKGFHLTSQELEREVGAFVKERTGNAVNLSSPDQTIRIDVLKDAAYVFDAVIPGAGGLPLGVSGRLLVRNDGTDSLAAAWMMMKRGCVVDVLGSRARVLEQWSVGRDVGYVSGEVSDLMGDYLGFVSGALGFGGLLVEPYPVFHPLIALPEHVLEFVRSRVA
ncbi:MAG: hypothetical protein JW834_02555 [Candidatus Diapherotrites archaeon]|nr:hypothetical protein [Candidatus Diapherotrites archaeon]